MSISFHNGILLAPPHYDSTPDHCTVAHCQRSGACAAPPPLTRPWRSRQRPLGGIGSGGQYFAANRSRRPQFQPRSILCQASAILSLSLPPSTRMYRIWIVHEYTWKLKWANRAQPEVLIYIYYVHARCTRTMDSVHI